MKITIFVSDAEAQRVEDAFAVEYGYQATVDGAPNRQTKTQFLQDCLRRHVREVTRGYETRVAVAAVVAPAEVTVT